MTLTYELDLKILKLYLHQSNQIKFIKAHNRCACINITIITLTLCMAQMNFGGRGFQKLKHYKQTDVTECITMLHSRVVTTVSNKFKHHLWAKYHSTGSSSMQTTVEQRHIENGLQLFSDASAYNANETSKHTTCGLKPRDLHVIKIINLTIGAV